MQSQTENPEPCRHLSRKAEACQAGRKFPTDCKGCTAYDPIPMLDDSERQLCEIWTRVMGYHRPITSFNAGKQGEVAERRYFREPAVL